MVTSVKQKMSAEAFDRFAQRPENAEKILELIAGEVLEVPSNPYVSMIAGLILTALNLYLRKNPLGQVTGEAGGYRVGGERYAPDVAYISYARQPELARSGYNPNPPDLAVEVISDPESWEEQRQLRIKLSSYQAAGVLVWVVNPEEQLVEVHQAGQFIDFVDIGGTLTGGDVLPGFELAVKDIFPAPPDTQETK
jgi:Uma2 family endonuclease